MITRLSPKDMQVKSSISPCKEKGSPDDSTKSRGVDLRREFPLYMGVRNTKEFLSDVGGYRTRWPVFVAASVLTVCLIGYSASHFLFKKAGTAHPATPEGQAAVELDAGASAAEGAVQTVEMSRLQRDAERPRKPKRAFAFSLQSEAEAAQERDFAPDISYAGHSENLGETGNPHIYKEVLALLKSASDAVKDENLESFLAHLDENESSFVRQQKLKAKIAFRQFDKIDGSYSDIKIKALNDSELAVNLHCKVNAAFAKSGRSIVLFDGAQNLTLRKAAGTVWKICAIE